ncbi:MAG: hydantoinase B/oxoprolinase family protein, partial [Deltaproteobacteria bacterium]
ESDTSMIVEERSLIQDSGGPGKQRGGIGRRMIFRSPDDGENSCGTVSIAVQAGRYIYPPQGMFEGKDGSLAKFQKNGENADPSTLTFMDPGDQISFVSAGGGGYGNPFERDPKFVEKDVQYEYISIEKAKQDYGVIIDPDSLTLDLDATLQLRKNK